MLLLERDDHLGGAAVSAQAFEGVDARLSRYSYLVSLLPQRIIDDLGLDVRLVRRRYSSYTPDPADPARGLLIDSRRTPRPSAAAFARDRRRRPTPTRWHAFYAETAALARAALPDADRAAADARRGARARWATTGSGRDVRRAAARRDASTSASRSDLVRGVVATDGLIGTFAELDDAVARRRTAASCTT